MSRAAAPQLSQLLPNEDCGPQRRRGRFPAHGRSNGKPGRGRSRCLNDVARSAGPDCEVRLVPAARSLGWLASGRRVARALQANQRSIAYIKPVHQGRSIALRVKSERHYLLSGSTGSTYARAGLWHPPCPILHISDGGR